MGYKVPSKCITFFLEILYVNVNGKSYKTTKVWKEGDKLLTSVYEHRVSNSPSNIQMPSFMIGNRFHR
jgi:hypothetical protein